MGCFVRGRDSDLKVHSSDENVLCVDPVLCPVSEPGTQEGWTLPLTSGCAGLVGARGRPPGSEESWFQALSGGCRGGGRGQFHRGGGGEVVEAGEEERTASQRRCRLSRVLKDE